jgi:hypothetical protein
MRAAVFWDVILCRMSGAQGFEKSCCLCSSKSPWSPYMTTQSFEAQWTTYPPTQCHIQEDLNPQQCQCENLKIDVRFSLFTPRWHTEIQLHSFLTSALQEGE